MNPQGHPAVVVHIPHASLVVPDDVALNLLLTPERLEHELLVMTDRYTDELFAPPSTLATTVAFPVSRVVVDPERFADDACEPMVARGRPGPGPRGHLRRYRREPHTRLAA